jgi:hypothetical protein
MCTLSVVPSRDGASLRLLMNRDERRLRSAAWPPVAAAIDGIGVLRPIDPPSGGTWIAASEAGLALALLNASGPPGSAEGRSRGTVIPALTSSATLDELEARWSTLDLTGVAPFTLVAATMNRLVTFQHLRTAAPVHLCTHAPFVATSSSLGDDLVRGPRQTLFAQLLTNAVDPWAAQSRFHQHTWPDRRHLSVLMSRPDACTVSRTEVILTAGRIDMRYAAIVDGWPAAVSPSPSSLTTRRTVRAA